MSRIIGTCVHKLSIKCESIIPLSVIEGKSKEINIKPIIFKINKRKLKKIRKEIGRLMKRHMKGDLNGTRHKL